MGRTLMPQFSTASAFSHSLDPLQTLGDPTNVSAWLTTLDGKDLSNP
jgi:hypothetical protein